MPYKALCDFVSPDSDVPCLDDAPIEVTVSQEGRSYRALLCKTHGQALINAGEPLTQAPSARVTQLPTAKPRSKQDQLVDQIDYPDCRSWLEAEGALPKGSRGRIKQELQQKWIDAGSPRPV